MYGFLPVNFVLMNNFCVSRNCHLEDELHATNGAREIQSGAVYWDKCWQLGP